MQDCASINAIFVKNLPQIACIASSARKTLRSRVNGSLKITWHVPVTLDVSSEHKARAARPCNTQILFRRHKKQAQRSTTYSAVHTTTEVHKRIGDVNIRSTGAEISNAHHIIRKERLREGSIGDVVIYAVVNVVALASSALRIQTESHYFTGSKSSRPSRNRSRDQQQVFRTQT